MKCEKCGREANFHYQSNVNGQITECYLCDECARAEGYGDMLSFNPGSMFGGFFGNPFGGFFGNPFGGLLGSRFMTPALALPVGIVFGNPGVSTENSGENTDNIPQDAGEEIRQKRELTSLKSQLQAAVKAEEYEKAAQLRDKIREMEK